MEKTNDCRDCKECAKGKADHLWYCLKYDCVIIVPEILAKYCHLMVKN